MLVNTHYQFPQAGVAVISHVIVGILVASFLSWFYLLIFDGHVVCNHNRVIPWYLASIGLVIVLLSIYSSLRRSRTIAGMMLKIETTLNKAATGEYPDKPLVFRKNDHFKVLAPALNRCLITLRHQDKQLQKTASRLDNLKQKVNSNEDRREVGRRIDEIIAELKQKEDEIEPPANGSATF